VQRAGDLLALQRLARAELPTQRHEARHLVLGELDLLAAERGQGQVGDLEVADAAGRVWGEGDTHGISYVISMDGVLLVGCGQPAVDAGFGWCGGAVDRSEPVVDGSGQLRIGAHPQLEDDVGDAELVAVDQLAQPLQPLDLTWAVVPVTSRGAQGRDEPGLLEISKHALRPAGGLGCLLNRQRVHPVKVTTIVSGLPDGAFGR
jgi:hypothetical protein